MLLIFILIICIADKSFIKFSKDLIHVAACLVTISIPYDVGPYIILLQLLASNLLGMCGGNCSRSPACMLLEHLKLQPKLFEMNEEA